MIQMHCDHCGELIDPEIQGGVRLKMAKKEYTFHLCGDCQVLLRQEVKENFLNGAGWKET